ncbi:MAG: hypothetical protein RBU25_12695 [Lentisphaeria bacterium]|jgi:hypothetical protein|nr:hypothetical protein [Lentisphaeria bacterium]
MFTLILAQVAEDMDGRHWFILFAILGTLMMAALSLVIPFKTTCEYMDVTSGDRHGYTKRLFWETEQWAKESYLSQWLREQGVPRVEPKWVLIKSVGKTVWGSTCGIKTPEQPGRLLTLVITDQLGAVFAKCEDSELAALYEVLKRGDEQVSDRAVRALADVAKSRP